MKYFKSRLAGLQVVVGQPDTKKGEVAPKTVDFTKVEEKYQGDRVYVGYLATDNKRALEVLANDPNVEEIDQDDYEQATKTGAYEPVEGDDDTEDRVDPNNPLNPPQE